MTKLLNVVDDRKTSWVYLVPVGVILVVFFGVLQGPNGDSKLQAALLAGACGPSRGYLLDVGQHVVQGGVISSRLHQRDHNIQDNAVVLDGFWHCFLGRQSS